MITATANGKKFTFPEGTTPEQMGVAIDEYFAGKASPVQGNDAGVMDAVAQADNGNSDPTDYYAKIDQINKGNPQPEKDENLSLPEFGTIDGNAALFGSQFGDENTGVGQLVRDAMAGLFVMNPKARVDGIEKRFPELKVERIGDGDNAVITNPETGGRAVVNAGGLSNQDIAPFVGYAIASIPAMKYAQGASSVMGAVAKGVAAEGATDAALQSGELLQGSEQGIDPARLLLTSASGGLVAGGGKVASNIIERRRELSQILDTDPDARVFDFIRSGSGKMQRDKAAVIAHKNGFDQAVIAAVKGSSKTDKRKMRQMLEIMEKGKRNATYSASNRPSDVIGRTLMERINVVRQSNQGAASQLNTVAKSLKGKSVDVDAPVNQFIDDLGEMGVSVDIQPGNVRVLFENSDIEGAGAAQQVINRIVKRMANTKTPDAYDVHRLKRYIDETVSYGKKVEGLTGNAERIVKKLRHNLDEALDSNFARYDKVNTVYAKTRDALDEFQKAAGSTVDLLGDNADKALGTLSRRILSNAQSRVRVMDAANKIQKVAIDQGGRFDDDLLTQVVFMDDLNRVFGTPAKTSFAGQVDEGVNATIDLATGGKTGAIRTAYRMAKDKATGINDETRFKAIRDLLTR